MQMLKKRPLLVIIGAGSIGQTCAHLLFKKFAVVFCDPRQNLRYTQYHSASFTKEYHGISTTNYCQLQYAPLSIIKNADIVLITTKAYAVAQVAHAIKYLLPPHIPVVVLINGMGAQQEVKKILRQQPVFIASTSLGAMHLSQHCTLKGMGTTFLELRSQTQSKTLQFFAQALPCQFTYDINSILLKKLAVNAVINPLTAQLNCKNGELLNYSELTTPLIAEVHMLLEKLGLSLSLADLTTIVLTTIHKTANNYSSMQQDFYYQRANELEYILGFLLQKARFYQLTCPQIQAIYQQLTYK